MEQWVLCKSIQVGSDERRVLELLAGLKCPFTILERNADRSIRSIGLLPFPAWKFDQVQYAFEEKCDIELEIAETTIRWRTDELLAREWGFFLIAASASDLYIGYARVGSDLCRCTSPNGIVASERFRRLCLVYNLSGVGFIGPEPGDTLWPHYPPAWRLELNTLPRASNQSTLDMDRRYGAWSGFGVEHEYDADQLLGTCDLNVPAEQSLWYPVVHANRRFAGMWVENGLRGCVPWRYDDWLGGLDACIIPDQVRQFDAEQLRDLMELTIDSGLVLLSEAGVSAINQYPRSRGEEYMLEVRSTEDLEIVYRAMAEGIEDGISIRFTTINPQHELFSEGDIAAVLFGVQIESRSTMRFMGNASWARLRCPVCSSVDRIERFLARKHIICPNCQTIHDESDLRKLEPEDGCIDFALYRSAWSLKQVHFREAFFDHVEDRPMESWVARVEAALGMSGMYVANCGTKYRDLRRDVPQEWVWRHPQQ